MYRVHENLGYANFTIQHQNVTIQEDMLIDTSCGLEVLFTEAYMRRLKLKEVAGYDFVVIGMGDTRQRAIRCEEVKITAVLVKKGSGEVVLARTSYLIPYVLIDGTVDAIGLTEDAPIPEDDSNVVDMDIGAILDLSAPSDSHGPVLAIGSIGCILGRPGLLRLGLEVHVSKEYLYPTTIVSAFVFPVMVL
jgi:hypothetical protein